jgi:hypothetical protein
VTYGGLPFKDGAGLARAAGVKKLGGRTAPELSTIDKVENSSLLLSRSSIGNMLMLLKQSRTGAKITLDCDCNWG